MIKEAIGTGSTVEAALEAARVALAAPEDADVVTEILEMPGKKQLFKGSTPARARAYYEESEFTKAESYIKTVLRLMGVEATVLTVEEDDGVRFSLDCGTNDGYVIGRRGETLDSLQYLTRLVVSRGREDYRRVTVNVGDYREQREQTLRDLALSSASKAKKYGRNISLPPMSPYDRRIIHTAVQETEGVSSFSVGEGGDRRVVVAPDEQYRRPERRGGYNNRDSRGGPRPGGDRPGGNLQRNQRNAQGRRFPGDNADYRRDDTPRRDDTRGDGEFRRSNDNFRRDDNPRRDDSFRRDDRRDFRRPPAQQQPQQPSRPPRSDATGAGRYGKIEPRRADQERPKQEEN
ncbi:MAG: protein jag [Oscillospiraceae bacterium]|jgi:spoIIIJ-associated protein|nr:protein jag [Oscillospiraceae bacterium]